MLDDGSCIAEVQRFCGDVCLGRESDMIRFGS